MNRSSGGGGRHAARVAAGILVTRVLGYFRERVFAHYFGITYVADAFKAALRIPNTLQNLFGEGVLSASFIPVYAKLLAQKDREEAGRLKKRGPFPGPRFLRLASVRQRLRQSRFGS